MAYTQYQKDIIEKIRRFTNDAELLFYEMEPVETDVEVCIKTQEISAFTFRIELPANSNSALMVSLTVKTEAFMFDGDRSDINMLITYFAALFLKVAYNYSVSIGFIEHPAVDGEIYGSYIHLFEKQYIHLENEDDFLELQVFIMNILLLDLALGKTFKLDKDSNLIAEQDDYLFESLAAIFYGHKSPEADLYNCSARKNDCWYFFHDFVSWTTVFEFEKPVFEQLLCFFQNYKIEKVKGVKNYILLQGNKMNAVGKKNLTTAKEVIDFMGYNKNFSFYAIDNFLFVMSQKTLICMHDDCSQRIAEKEKLLIQMR